MDILISFDEGYAQPAGVMVASLARAVGSPGDCTVHAIAVDVSAESKARVTAAAAGLPISWIEPDPVLLGGADVSSLPGLTYISRTTLYVLLLDVLLPAEVDRVLALDVDLMVRRDPRPLWEADLDGCPVGAIRDAELTSTVRAIPEWRELHIDPASPYFNAGVILIDRRAWSDLALGERALELMRRLPRRLRYNEQDALNVVVGGAWQALPWTWNFQVPVEVGLGGDAAPVYGSQSVDEIDAARRDPSIVHYSGSRKPWHRGAEELPFVREWQALQAGTPWAGTPAVRRPTDSAVRAVARRLSKAGRVLVRGS